LKNTFMWPLSLTMEKRGGYRLNRRTFTQLVISKFEVVSY